MNRQNKILSVNSMNLLPQHIAGFLVVLATSQLALAPESHGADAEDGFRPIFDGRSLAGWETPEGRYWTIEDGAITGRITPEQPCTINQYLVWTGGELADFELKLKSRLNGQGGINNGFQFRSRLLPDHDVCGYQVDNNLQTPWLVRLYDEFGRHTLAMRGERAAFNALNQRTASPLPESAGTAWFKLEEWHEYHLVCRGSRISLHVDGRLAAEVDDHDPHRAEAQGILALQLHSGPPTVVQFKDIRLKILKPAASPTPPPTVSPALERLQQEAVAWWSLDTGGHGAKPPLRHIPGWDQFELNVRPSGPGARANTKIVTLDGAHFETEPSFPLTSGPFTVFIRAFQPKGPWNAALLAKPGQDGTAGLRWFFDDLPETPGPDLVLELGGPAGKASVHAPLMSTNPAAWMDLVARCDGRTLALFIDGERRASAEGSGSWNSSGQPLLLAAERQGDRVVRHVRGEMETTAVWSRALSDEEIRTLTQPARGEGP